MRPSNPGESTVFELALGRERLSVPQVAEELGLPATTVIGIFGRLSGDGLLARDQDITGRRGRPTATYAARLPGPLLCCLLDGSLLVAALIGRDLEPAAVEEVNLAGVPESPDGGAAAVIALLREAVERVLGHAGCADEPPTGAALSVNAVDVGDRTLTSSVAPWVNQQLPQAVADALRLPVRRVHDVHVVAEYRRATSEPPAEGDAAAGERPAEGADPLVLLRVADGVSAHAVVAGKAFRGATHLSGELGHVIAEPAGPLCGCGRHGCLETLCSGPAIARRVRDGLAQGAQSELDARALAGEPPRVVVERLWDAWRRGDSFARAAMEDVFDRLAWGLGLAVNLLDPRLVAVGGYVMEGRDGWIEDVVRRSQRWTLHAAKRRLRFAPQRSSIIDQLRVAALHYFYQPNLLTITPGASAAAKSAQASAAQRGLAPAAAAASVS